MFAESIVPLNPDGWNSFLSVSSTVTFQYHLKSHFSSVCSWQFTDFYTAWVARFTIGPSQKIHMAMSCYLCVVHGN